MRCRNESREVSFQPSTRLLRGTAACRENHHAPEERYKQSAPAGNRDINRRELGDASHSTDVGLHRLA